VTQRLSRTLQFVNSRDAAINSALTPFRNLPQDAAHAMPSMQFKVANTSGNENPKDYRASSPAHCRRSGGHMQGSGRDSAHFSGASGA